MDWLGIRREARRQMHETFGVRARYVPAAGEALYVSARRVIDIEHFGDLGSDGYAQVLASVPRIALLRAEVPQPKRGDVVAFSDGLSFRIENIEPGTDDLTWTAEVSHVG